MKLRFAVCFVLVCFCFAVIASAQDAVKVDPKHYKVISENDKVRILKIHYGPHEKSVMHSHPDAVVIYQSDGVIKMTGADGKSQNATAKNGESMFTPAVTHLPENTGDKGFDAILVELKKK
jgi:quercetin dioxygenase-like cupin family protein